MQLVHDTFRSLRFKCDAAAGGLLWIQEWSSLQQGINSGLLASFYSDYLSDAKQSLTCGGKSFTAAQLKTFAASQVRE